MYYSFHFSSVIEGNKLSNSSDNVGVCENLSRCRSRCRHRRKAGVCESSLRLTVSSWNDVFRSFRNVFLHCINCELLVTIELKLGL